MIILSKEQIIMLHEQLIERYGGIQGVRDEGLLDSAINAPFQSFGGQDFFPTVAEKAVRLCIDLIQNHPFHDGNKRIGTLALLMVLELNNISFHATNEELSDIIIQYAAGQVNDDDLQRWVSDHMS